MFEEDMAKIVRQHSLLAAIVMAIPMFGLGIIFFIGILWHMYYKLCEKCNTKLKLSTIALGFIINIIIAIGVNFLLMMIPIIGWLGTGLIVYIQFYFSGKGYIEVLRKLTL